MKSFFTAITLAAVAVLSSAAAADEIINTTTPTKETETTAVVDVNEHDLFKKFTDLFDIECLLLDIFHKDFTFQSIGKCLKDDDDLPVDPRCVYDCMESNEFKLTFESATCSLKCVEEKEMMERILEPVDSSSSVKLSEKFTDIFDVKCLIKTIVHDEITIETIGDCLVPEPEDKVDLQCVYECFKTEDFDFTEKAVQCSLSKCVHNDFRRLPEGFGKNFDIKCLIHDVVTEDISLESIGACLKPQPDAKVDPQCVYECFEKNDFKLTPQTAVCSVTQCMQNIVEMEMELHKAEASAIAQELALPAYGEREIFNRECILKLAFNKEKEFSVENLEACYSEDIDVIIDGTCIYECIKENGMKLNVEAAKCSLQCIDIEKIEEEVMEREMEKANLPKEFTDIFDVDCLIDDVIHKEITIDSVGKCLKEDEDLPIDPKCVFDCVQRSDDQFTPAAALCSLKCINRKSEELLNEEETLMTSRKRLRN